MEMSTEVREQLTAKMDAQLDHMVGTAREMMGDADAEVLSDEARERLKDTILTMIEESSPREYVAFAEVAYGIARTIVQITAAMSFSMMLRSAIGDGPVPGGGEVSPN
jgi:hypothetical protein